MQIEAKLQALGLVLPLLLNLPVTVAAEVEIAG